MRSFPMFLALSVLTACGEDRGYDPSHKTPASLGEFVPLGMIDAHAGDESVVFAKYQLAAESTTTLLTFQMLVPAASSVDGDSWVSDVYNYSERPHYQRPVLTTVQQSVTLCWLATENGDVVSAGAVPNTDGEFAFQIGYGKPLAGAVLSITCDVTDGAQPLAIGIRHLSSYMYDGNSNGKEFYWYGTVFRMTPNVAQIVTIN